MDGVTFSLFIIIPRVSYVTRSTRHSNPSVRREIKREKYICRQQLREAHSFNFLPCDIFHWHGQISSRSLLLTNSDVVVHVTIIIGIDCSVSKSETKRSLQLEDTFHLSVLLFDVYCLRQGSLLRTAKSRPYTHVGHVNEP